MNFSTALDCMKVGDTIWREGWNGKGLHIKIIADLRFGNKQWIGIYKDNILLGPFTASQSDLLSEDWETSE